MIFPMMADAAVGYIDLNSYARRCVDKGIFEQKGDRSIFLDPKICQRLVNLYHEEFYLEYSYGGWMEDRSFIWKGSYLEEKNTFIHLGVDFNVPPGEVVAIDHDVKVILVDNDTPEEHGWGTRVIFEMVKNPIVLIYAHLAPDISCQIGDLISAGTSFGKTGMPAENGGWYPHLHVQAVRKSHYEELLKDKLSNLDGYGSFSRSKLLGYHFPDPGKFI